MTTRVNFAPLKDTWTENSDLKMDNWNPYPELENTLNNYNGCFYKEGYTNIKKSNYCTLDSTWTQQNDFTLN
jgi:hypothetical protein